MKSRLPHRLGRKLLESVRESAAPSSRARSARRALRRSTRDARRLHIPGSAGRPSWRRHPRRSTPLCAAMESRIRVGHADDESAAPIQLDVLASDPRIAAETSLPQLIAEHHRHRIGACVVVGEQPAGRGHDAENSKGARRAAGRRSRARAHRRSVIPMPSFSMYAPSSENERAPSRKNTNVPDEFSVLDAESGVATETSTMRSGSG